MCVKTKDLKLEMMVHICHTRTWEMEVGRCSKLVLAKRSYLKKKVATQLIILCIVLYYLDK